MLQKTNIDASQLHQLKHKEHQLIRQNINSYIKKTDKKNLKHDAIIDLFYKCYNVYYL